MTELLRAGKSIPFESAIIKATTVAGVFDEGSLVKRTSDRFFDAFVLGTDNAAGHFSRRMLEAIRQNYRPYSFVDRHYLSYVRKQP
jgi:hypothetical protein